MKFVVSKCATASKYFFVFSHGREMQFFRMDGCPAGGKLLLLTNGQKFTLLIPFCAAFASLSLFRAKEKHKARGRNEGYEWFFCAQQVFSRSPRKFFPPPPLTFPSSPWHFLAGGGEKKGLCHDTNSFFCQGLLTVGCTHEQRGERRPYLVRSQ